MSEGSEGEVRQKVQNYLATIRMSWMSKEIFEHLEGGVWKAIEARRKERREEHEQRRQEEQEQIPEQELGEEEGRLEETRAESTDEPEVTGKLAEVRTGRGSASLVRGGDERHWADESSRKGKGKGNGGKGEHGGKGGDGSKGTQQVENLAMDGDQEDKRGRVAPNMGAGGSHSQATSDPGKKEAEEKRLAQEAREEQRRAQEEKRAQEERVILAREAKAQEERREQDREAVAQEGHEGEVKPQEEQGEEAKSLHEKSHVSNRHMTWWHDAWWVRVNNGPHLQTARDRRRVWRAATRAAQEVREAENVAGKERREWDKGETERKESNTLHLVIHFPRQPLQQQQARPPQPQQPQQLQQQCACNDAGRARRDDALNKRGSTRDVA